MRLGFSRAALGTLAAVIALAGAGSAVYEVAGRGAAHAEPATPVAHQEPVTLGASASPASLAYGTSLSVTGSLVDAVGVPIAGERVEVVAARVDTPSHNAVVAVGVTDAAGRIAEAVRPAASSTVWLRYAGSASWAPAVSVVSLVDVRKAVTLTGSVRGSPGKWVASLRGTVSPALAGERVRIERRFGAGWRLEALRPVSASGTFTFSKPHATVGTFAYRVVRRADAAFGESSARYDVRVAMPVPRPPPALGSGAGGGRALLATGDSLVHFLGQQLAATRKGLATVVDSRHSSGLARPDYFDWTAYARSQVAAHNPSTVVLWLGANDCQPLRRNRTGAWAAVGTAAWSAEYTRRTVELLRVYTTGAPGRRVHWLGLPVVRDPEIASCYRGLNAATAAAVKQVRGVTWTDTWPLYVVDGHYSDYIGGVLVRQEDGIHLTSAGTRLATRVVLALLTRK